MAKVLVIIPDHKYGGEENRSHRIYRGLKNRGLSASFVTESSNYEFDDNDLIALPNLDNVLYLPINLIKLYLLIKRKKFDVVLLFKRKSCFIGWVLEYLIKEPAFVFNVANAWQSKRFLWRFSPRYMSTLSKRLVPDYILDAKHIQKINIGVPLAKDTLLAGVSSIDPIRLISAGKLSYQKNHLKLLSVAKRIADKGFDVIVDIAGDGPMRSEIEDKALSLGIKILLRGQVSNMEAFYELGGIYVQVSNFEGMPNALLEAGQYGIPVVANNVGATADLIDSDTGWLLSSDDVASYEAAIVDIINNTKEVVRRTTLMRERVIRDHDVESMCHGYKAFIDQIVGKNL
jgi:glycosyltransferase involved in cell wall biosynthesis